MSTGAPAFAPGPDFDLVACRHFTIAQLTEAYNHTRVDYLVPMPMNAERLAEYIALYDVDLDRSYVAVDGDRVLGLGMLGVRSGHAWITRLGVLPDRRRRGVGEAIVRALLAEVDDLGIDHVMLEVIVNNAPAYALFVKCGFAARCEYLVLRRPPGPVRVPAGSSSPPALSTAPAAVMDWLDVAGALRLVAEDSRRQPWTNEIPTFAHAGDALGLRLTLPDGSCGWLVCRRQRFYLSHIVVVTEMGPPADVGSALLAALHGAFPDLDTYAENVATDDPHLPAFTALGYIESFRRIEMERRS